MDTLCSRQGSISERFYTAKARETANKERRELRADSARDMIPDSDEQRRAGRTLLGFDVIR